MRRARGAGVWGKLGAAALLFSAAGCGDNQAGPSAAPEWPDDGDWWHGGGSGGGGGSGAGAGGGGEQPLPPPDLVGKVRRILTEHCAPCHAGREGVEYGGFGDIYNVEAMMGAGLIVPGDAESSPFYQKISAGQMPPGTLLGFTDEGEPIFTPGVVDPFDPTRIIGAVSAEDLATVGEWIGWGAPSLRDGWRRLYGGAELRSLLAADAAKLPPADLPFYRYVALSYFHGSNRFRGRDIDDAANAIGALLNALSPSRQASGRPVPLLDDAGEVLALRVDLRDYELDEADWARIEGASGLVDRQAFPCELPFLQAEQLLAMASTDENIRADGRVESVYSNIVLRRLLERAGVLAPGQLVFEPTEPGAAGTLAEPLTSEVTLPELASALGVDLARDIEQGAAFRACVRQSNVSTHQRCLQRDPMQGGPGRGFWWAMNLDPASTNVLTTPVGPGNGDLVPAQEGVDRFSMTSGVAFWAWPNDMPGFAAFDGQLRLRSAALEYLYGPYAPGALAGAGACFYCHGDGPLPATDEVLPALDRGDGSADFSQAEADFVRRLFRPQSVVAAHVALDNASLAEAQRERCLRGCDDPYAVLSINAGVHTLSQYWYYDMGGTEAAASLFLDTETFETLVVNDPELSAAMPEYTGGVARPTFVELYDLFKRAAISAGADEAALNFCATPAAAQAASPAPPGLRAPRPR